MCVPYELHTIDTIDTKNYPRAKLKNTHRYRTTAICWPLLIAAGRCRSLLVLEAIVTGSAGSTAGDEIQNRSVTLSKFYPAKNKTTYYCRFERPLPSTGTFIMLLLLLMTASFWEFVRRMSSLLLDRGSSQEGFSNQLSNRIVHVYSIVTAVVGSRLSSNLTRPDCQLYPRPAGMQNYVFLPTV